MVILNCFQCVILVISLLNTSPALSMRTWELHPGLINEYDDCVSPVTSNQHFGKFIECIQDKSWTNRKIHGEENSIRFQGNPPLIFDFLKASYSASSKKLVMDLAGADGRVAELALFTGAKVLLIDRNPIEIKDANERIKHKRKLPNEFLERYESYVVDVLQMDEKLPQFAGQIDCICMSNLIHFFNGEQTEKLLHNLSLFLKKGGKVYGEVDSIYASPKNFLEKFIVLENSDELYPGICSMGQKIHNYYSINSLQNLLKKFGFNPISIYYCNEGSLKLPIESPEKSVKVVFSFEK